MKEDISLLHVDEDKEFLSMASRLIKNRSSSIEVFSTSSISEAMNIIGSEDIECVVSDYEMGDTNRLEFLEQVRGKFTEMPFILLTGEGSEDLASKAISKGVTDYIKKEEFAHQKGLLAKRIKNAVEKRRTEQALEESEEKYRTLVEQTQSAIYIYKDDNFKFFNERVEEITGYNEDELNEITPVELIHPEDREDVRKIVRRRAKGKDVESSYEARVVTKSGDTRYCKFNVRSVRYKGEKAFLGSVVDITKQKEAHKKLEKSKKRFEALFERANDSILLIKDREILDCNNHALKFLKAEKDEVVGAHPIDFAPEFQEDGRNSEEKAKEMYQKALNGEKPVFTWTVKDKEGKRFQVEVSFTKVSFDNESVIQAVVRDLSDLQRVVDPLHNVTRDLMKAETVQEVLDIASEAAKKMLGFSGTSIRSYNPETNKLELVSLGGVVGEDIDRPDFDIKSTPHGKAFRLGETVIDDIGDEDEFEREVFSQTMYVPIGEYGTLSTGIVEGRYSERDRKISEILAKNTESALEKVEIVERLKERERETEKRYLTLVEEANSAVTIFQNGEIVFANSKTAELLSTSKDKVEEDIIGEPLVDFVAPEERDKIMERHKNRLSGKEVPDHYESKALTVDGKKVPIELNLSLIEYQGQKAVMAVIRDISKSKGRERKILGIQKSTQKFFGIEDKDQIAELAVKTVQNIFGFEVSGIHLLNSEGKLEPVHVTEKTKEIFDGLPRSYSKDDTDIWKVFEKEEALKLNDISDSDEVKGDTPVKSFIALPLKEHGVLIISSLEKDSFTDEDAHLGKIFSLSISAAMDRAEIEEELKKERDRFASLFKNIPDPTVFFGASKKGEAIIKSVNPAFEEVFGFKEEEVKGESIDKYIVPEDKMEEAKKINEMASEGKEIEREVIRMTSDGKKDFLIRNASPKGQSLGYAIYTDITEQKEREREINRQRKRLEKFASVLSHDLRNPLNIAQGYVEIARKSDFEEGLDEIKSAHSRIESIIESMLELARKGQTVTETEEVSLKPIVKEAWSMISSKDAKLVVEDDFKFYADRSRFLSVLENLLRNAVEHGEEDGKIRIGMIGSTEGFYFENSGDPIPDEHKEEVFKYGYSDSGGTGFGLAIVKSIIDAHGWNIELKDSELGGPRFEVEFV